MNHMFRILLGALCLAGLLLVRFRENDIFYDPLIDYFHGEYQNNSLPLFDEFKLLLNIAYRYLLNFVLSYGILLAFFRERGVLKFSALLYLVTFLVLIVVFFILLKNYDPQNYLPLFYVRRFLIQPLLVFLLIPAFLYYQKVNR